MSIVKIEEQYRPDKKSVLDDKSKIEAICDQLGCTLEQARLRLVAANGDAVNAILSALE